MNVYEIIGSQAHWQVNKCIAKKCGIYAALLLADLVSKRQWFIINDYISEGDWFFNTVNNIEMDTSLSKYQQSEAIKNLTAAGFIKTKYKDVPKKRYYLISDENILATLLESQKSKNLTTVGQKTSPQEVKKLDTNNNKELTINNNNKADSDFEEVWALFRRKESKADARAYFTSKARESERGLIKDALIAYNKKYDKKYGSDLSFLLAGNSFFKKERWREHVPTKEEVEAVKIPKIPQADGIPSKRLDELWAMALKQKNSNAFFVTLCIAEKSYSE